MTELAQVLPVIAGVVAGIGWSTIGIWSKWKSNQDAAVDWIKLRKNLVIGAGTGVITYFYGLTQGGAPVINSIEAFAAAVATYFGLVVVVDKLLTRNDEVDMDE
jgi:uncharacterized membrane protein